MTQFKNTAQKYLSEEQFGEDDAVVIDGIAYSYREGDTESISVRDWHKLFAENRISENQYFAGLSVSVTAARKAIGTDQIEDITVKSTTKTKSIRTEKAEGKPDGTVIPHKVELPTKEQTKTVSKPMAGTGVEPERVKVTRTAKIIKVRR